MEKIQPQPEQKPHNRYKGYKTIRFPMDESQYGEFLHDRAFARAYLDERLAQHAEIFPAQMQHGYHLNGFTETSVKLGLRQRRLRLKATGEVFTLAPSFVMPGQNDVLEGKIAFRNALDNLGTALPPGFEITSIREIGDTGEIVSVVNWKSSKIPGGSQLAVLFRFTSGKVHEERWFVDTEQWKAAF